MRQALELEPFSGYGIAVLAWARLKRAWFIYRHRGGVLLGASAAFFGLLSVVPLCAVGVTLTGLVLDSEDARAEMTRVVSSRLGDDVATTLVTTLDTTRSDWVASGIALLIALIASGRLIAALDRGLGVLWSKPATRAPMADRVRAWFKRKAVASLSTLGVAVIIIARFALEFVAEFMSAPPALVHISKDALMCAVIAIAIGLLFRYKSSETLTWPHAMLGGSCSAVLMWIVSLLASIYVREFALARLGKLATHNLALLLWAYYTAQAFYFGAALTWAWRDAKEEALVVT